jgi:hypothetical protein
MGHLSAAKFHDADYVRRLAIICKHIFCDPKIIFAQDALDRSRWHRMRPSDVRGRREYLDLSSKHLGRKSTWVAKAPGSQFSYETDYRMSIVSMTSVTIGRRHVMNGVFR